MDSYVASEATPIVPSMTLPCDGTMVRGRSSLPASFVWGYFALPIRDLVEPNPFLVIPRLYSKGPPGVQCLAVTGPGVIIGCFRKQ